MSPRGGDAFDSASHSGIANDRNGRHAISSSSRAAGREDAIDTPPKKKRLLVWLLTGAISIATFVIARSGRYTPGSDVGYYLGLSGSLMMLTLLLYPLRKRLPWLGALGRLNKWFSAHMVLGVAGPILILLHCTLRWQSLNAAVAFWCMVIVASSGLVGRFLYSRLHQGLYGRQLTLPEVRMSAAMAQDAAKRQQQPGRDDRLRNEMTAFAEAANYVALKGWKRPFALMTLGVRARRAEARCDTERNHAVGFQASLEVSETVASTVEYIRAAQRAAQFIPFERMFALWHVLHIPLVFIMVISVIAHIIAVHMY